MLTFQRSYILPFAVRSNETYASDELSLNDSVTEVKENHHSSAEGIMYTTLMQTFIVGNRCTIFVATARFCNQFRETVSGGEVDPFLTDFTDDIT